MPQDELDDANVCAAFQEVCGKSVSQAMRRHALAHATTRSGTMQGLTHRLRQEVRLGILAAGEQIGTARAIGFVIGTQRDEQTVSVGESTETTITETRYRCDDEGAFILERTRNIDRDDAERPEEHTVYEPALLAMPWDVDENTAWTSTSEVTITFGNDVSTTSFERVCSVDDTGSANTPGVGS